MSKKLLMVVNPTSGKMKIKNQLLNVCKIFCEAGFEVSIHVTANRLDATRITKERGGSFDVVIACGGDGTFNEVVAGAMEAKFAGALGFLPCGTTNDLASTMGIPKTISKAAELIAATPPREMDFGLFNGSHYFSYVATFGAFSAVAYSTDQRLKNLFGHAAYMTEALAQVKDVRPYRMRVICDDTVIEDEFLFGAVANALSIGGVMKLKKDEVDVSDGYHELVLMKNPKNAADISNLSREFFSGKFENKSILLLRGKRIVFECEESLAWCTDGEYAGNHERVQIQNLHGVLSVIRP
jgi:YegS/Rv2252/BmrU family lipid kinase